MKAEERIYSRADKLTAAVTTVVAGAVYFYTAQPNVGLLDCGQFLSGSFSFYPLAMPPGR